MVPGWQEVLKNVALFTRVGDDLETMRFEAETALMQKKGRRRVNKKNLMGNIMPNRIWNTLLRRARCTSKVFSQVYANFTKDPNAQWGIFFAIFAKATSLTIVLSSKFSTWPRFDLDSQKRICHDGLRCYFWALFLKDFQQKMFWIFDGKTRYPKA